MLQLESLSSKLAESSSSTAAAIQQLKTDLDATKRDVTALSDQAAGAKTAPKAVEPVQAGTLIQKAELEAMLQDASDTNASMVMDLRNKVMPLFEEVVKRVKALESKPGWLCIMYKMKPVLS